MGSTPVLLAAMKGNKDVVLILIMKGANLDIVNAVSVHAYMLYDKVYTTEHKM